MTMTDEERQALTELRETYAAVSLSPSMMSPSVVYHYTSAAGLCGILSEGTLRATNFGYLNDSSEIHHGRKLVSTLITQRLAKNLQPTQRQLLTDVQQGLDDIGRGREFYLACFCEKGDLLSQWRGYGSARDRFAIGFDTERLPLGLPYRFNKVLYRRRDQEGRVSRAIKSALSAAKNAAASPDFLSEVADSLSDKLVKELAFFKDWSFRDEREWRAVCLLRGEAEIHFDTAAGFVRPFVNLWTGERDASGQRRLPVTRITAFARRSVRSVELLLSKCGYRDIPVDCSKVPYQEF